MDHILSQLLTAAGLLTLTACSSRSTISERPSKMPAVTSDTTPHHTTVPDKNNNADAPMVGEIFLRADELQLKADKAARKRDLVENDLRLIELDKQIRHMEITHQKIAEENHDHPEHRQADVSDIIEEFVRLRKDIAAIQEKYRKATERGSPEMVVR